MSTLVAADLPDDAEIYYSVHDAQSGPVDIAAFVQKVVDGEVNDDTLVWWDGQEDWVPLGTSGLAYYTRI